MRTSRTLFLLRWGSKEQPRRGAESCSLKKGRPLTWAGKGGGSGDVPLLCQKEKLERREQWTENVSLGKARHVILKLKVAERGSRSGSNASLRGLKPGKGRISSSVLKMRRHYDFSKRSGKVRYVSQSRFYRWEI